MHPLNSTVYAPKGGNLMLNFPPIRLRQAIDKQTGVFQYYSLHIMKSLLHVYVVK